MPTPEIFGVSAEVYFIFLVLCILAFFFWRWLLKSIQHDRARKIGIWIATISSVPLIYFGMGLVWIYSISYYPSNKFDRQKWFNDPEKRYDLSEDIIESNILIGKTKAEIKQMLGDEENSDGSDHWNYNLGFRPGLFNIDPDVLDIYFKDGKVVKVGQHET